MAKHAPPPPPAGAKPTLAMTMFGVTTPCCDAVRAAWVELGLGLG